MELIVKTDAVICLTSMTHSSHDSVMLDNVYCLLLLASVISATVH